LGNQWLIPIILATQEAEIWKISVRKSVWANSSRDPVSKKKNHHKKELAEWLRA
jgi:hypothetical protein